MEEPLSLNELLPAGMLLEQFADNRRALQPKKRRNVAPPAARAAVPGLADEGLGRLMTTSSPQLRWPTRKEDVK